MEKYIFKRRKVMLNTLCFVIGISFAFFLLGLGVSAIGTFFQSNQLLFARIGGILVVLLGCISWEFGNQPHFGAGKTFAF